MDSTFDRFSTLFSTFIGGGRTYLLAKGRVALYLALRGLDVGRGRKVILPGYTCVVVPGAVKAAGVELVYVDVDARTFNISPEHLEAISPRDVGAIVVQHTYGIPADMTRIGAWACRYDIPIIEDCCHAFGSGLDGRMLGTFGNAAFFSGQWSKPFSTGLGGMLLVSDSGLIEKVERIIAAEVRAPSLIRQWRLRAQILAFRAAVTPSRLQRITTAYRALSRWGLVVGSSETRELEGDTPSQYVTGMAPCQAREGIRQMRGVQRLIANRRVVAREYSRRLPELGFRAVTLEPGEDPVLLRYPVRVGNKRELLEAARQRGLWLGSWFESPLHPAESNLGAFGYRPGTCSVGEQAAREVVNLPCDPGVDERHIDAVLRFLRERAIPA